MSQQINYALSRLFDKHRIVFWYDTKQELRSDFEAVSIPDVEKLEIANNEYDLSINRYKEVVYEAVEYDPPKVILERLAELEDEIAKGREELEGMLG